MWRTLKSKQEIFINSRLFERGLQERKHIQ